jgi:hypothetical protein
MNNQASTNSCITFYDLALIKPISADIRDGIYARNKMSGDWIRIPKTSAVYDVNVARYSHWTRASNFPNSNPYPAKYDDLVAAKDVLKNDRYAYDSDTIGKAIALIKRFLETHAK